MLLFTNPVGVGAVFYKFHDKNISKIYDFRGYTSSWQVTVLLLQKKTLL